MASQYLDTPWPSQRPPYSPTLINLNQNYNMTANSLTEALLILGSMYLSLVQPESEPANVSIYTIFTDSFTKVRDRQEFILDKPHQPGSTIRSKPVLNATTVKHVLQHKPTPRNILNMLCEDFFIQNAVTVLLINNHYSKTKFSSPDAVYLRKTFESLGVPIISYDTKISEKSKRSLTLELAPTISQMMDAFFAFLKKFSWTDFSFLCALSTGCESAVESIRQKVDESNKMYNISVYGVDIFAYRLLSYVNITNVSTMEEITDKLMYDLDRDTRIVLVHGDSRNVLTIMEKAKEIGLTREDYVWIFTLTAMEQAALGDTVNPIYPIGSFVIGFDSKVEDLTTDAHKLWFSTLRNMAAANEIENIDFQTHFNCDVHKSTISDGPTTLFWKYGETLYKYLLKGKFSDQIEFDDKGFLKFNMFWIKNVQPMAGSEISDKKDSTQSFQKISDSRFKTSSRQSPLSAQKRDPEHNGFQESVRHSFMDRNSAVRQDLVRPSFIDRNSAISQDVGFSDSSQDQDVSDNETPNVNSQTNQAETDISDYRNRSMKFPLKYGNVKMKHQDVQHRQYGRHRMAKRNSRPFGRKFHLNSLQKVATWNGHNLTVTGIVWPGGASTPPKGKPEKYILKVVTWAEDPHVIYTPVKNQSGLSENKCESNALPCKVYIRDNHLHRMGNQTRDVCCTGLTIDLLQRLSQMLSFDVEITEVADGSYGSPVNNNESDWTGMVGMLIHKKADMAIGALSITPERSVVVDFSMPFLQTGITIIVAVREGAISPTAFLEPYDYPSWSLILLFSVHATGASIFIFEWLSPYGLDQGKTSLRVHKFSLFRSFWLIWAMLFGASVSTDQPRGCASRFLANIWALFAVVFCASYTANLAAFMITKDDYYDLSGIQDWRLKNPHHRQPPFKYATIANSSTDLNIAKNYKTIHTYMKNDAQTSVKDAIKALKKQEIQAFIYDSTTLEYEFGKDVGCKLKTVGKRIAETGYGIAFPKKSHWVKKVDKALLKLQEDGEIERLQKFWLAGACHKKKERGVSSHTLGILNFTSAFILLGGGVILGVILLVMEHIYFRFGRKSLKKWDKCGCCSLVSLSMGQSLTFEQSVIDAIDYHRHHKCKDPLCETQLWKVKHELDIALLKISQLRRLLAHSASLEAARDQASVYKLEQHDPTQVNGNARRRRRQQKSDTVSSGGDNGATKSLLALEGKGDTDEEDGLMKPFTSSQSSPKKITSPMIVDIPLQNLQSVQHAPIYENSLGQVPKQVSSKDQTPRQASTAQITKTRVDKSKNVADLELHPPPPSFDEAVSGYSDTQDSSPLPPPPTDLTGSSDTSQSSDAKRYEPFILDSPESPSSTFSDLSASHRLPSPGDLSKLSDECQSSPASPSKDSNFTSSPDMRHSQGDRSSGMMSSTYSNTQSPHNKPSGYSVFTGKSDNDQTISKEDDNDVSTRRIHDSDGNVYVNVDDIIGKETSF